MGVAITNDFETIKLNDTVPGRCKFWDHIMSQLENAQIQLMEHGKPGLTALVFGKKIENVGGYFTNGNYVPRIVLPANTATFDEVSNTVTFADEDGFGVFVHEASHFLHLMMDEGRYTAKPLRGQVCKMFSRKKEDTRQDEFEAGWRALVYNNLYDLQLKDKLFEQNRNNMMIYLDKPECISFIRERIDKAYTDSHDKMTKDDWKRFVDETLNPTLVECQNVANECAKDWAKSITKFSELSDFKNHMVLSQVQLDKIETALKKMEGCITGYTTSMTPAATSSNVSANDDDTAAEPKSNVAIPNVTL